MRLRGRSSSSTFWTYSCINCLRALPYVRAWAEKYKDQGLVVIGVHAPEFAFEKNVDNVRAAIASLRITYPVAIDNDYAIWRAFNNQYWPAHYFIDAKGRIRHHHFGEGDYAGSERVIQQLLAEAGEPAALGDLVSVSASGAEAAPDLDEVRSPETYIGYERAQKLRLAWRRGRGRPPRLYGRDTAAQRVEPRRRLDSQKGFVTAIRACGSAGGSVAKGMTKISYKGYRFPC